MLTKLLQLFTQVSKCGPWASGYDILPDLKNFCCHFASMATNIFIIPK